MAKTGKVLMIYTGGTIGMLPEDETNPLSPLKPANWKKLRKNVHFLKELPLDVHLEQMRLIDSSDMHPDYWIDIARVIGKNYDEFDGFVVLHGTDTMSYTATALSFLLENLGKPVICTGSQISICEPRSDAVQNLVTSLMLASPKTFDLPVVAESCIFFHNLLLRGNRTRKVSSRAYAGFNSPNFKPLGTVGERIRIDKTRIRQPSDQVFYFHEHLEKNVLIFDIFPGIKREILRSLFDIEGLKGVVLRTYGAGNAPTNKGFLEEISYGISKKNLAIVNVTQCNEGMVKMGLYDNSAQIQRLGVISGVDMTPESALVKMMLLLGMGHDIDTVKDQMQKDLRGEQSVNVFNFFHENGIADPVYRARAQQVSAKIGKNNIVQANIRIDNASFAKEDPEGEISLAFFINYPSAEDTKELSDEKCLEILQCLGIAKKVFLGTPVNIIVDCTERFARVFTPGQPIQVTIVSCSGKTVRWEGASISVYSDVD